MTISPVNSGASYLNTARSKNTTHEASFAQTLADQIATHAAGSNPTNSTGLSQSTVVATDGAKLTVINVAAILTPEDKAVLGWPSQNAYVNAAAVMVALDRQEGLLTGPLTKDYISGNAAKYIPGLAERFPAGMISNQTIDQMLLRLDRLT